MAVVTSFNFESYLALPYHRMPLTERHEWGNEYLNDEISGRLASRKKVAIERRIWKLGRLVQQAVSDVAGNLDLGSRFDQEPKLEQYPDIGVQQIGLAVYVRALF